MHHSDAFSGGKCTLVVISYMADTSDTSTAEDQTGLDGDDAALLRKIKRWVGEDREHWADWRKEAEEDYGFVAGDQWDSKDIDRLKELFRPVITFNRIDPLIRSVSGEQINNGQEVRYIPRELGDVKANEYLTSAADWFRDQCDADDEESDGFWDAAVCGVGATETRLELDDPDEPMPLVDRIDPLEVVVDKNARKRNFSDARRISRIRVMAKDEAKRMFPDAASSDLHAGWAQFDDVTGDVKDDRAKQYETDRSSGDGDDDDGDDDALVTIVQTQWWETESYYRVAVPPALAAVVQGVKPDGTMEMSAEEHDGGIGKRLKELAGGQLQSVKLQRKVFKQAFIGKTFLKPVGPTPCPDHFSINCITGFRDRNKGTFYGLVRAMKDPQRWANKWLSQTLHIMNSNAKGGVMMEEGAVDNQREFEESFAKVEAVTLVPAGTLGQYPKIVPKPVAQFPAGFYQLMEFAISSVRDVAGINLEMMGMREANQPASLEYQRRQAGVTILAQLFRSLRRYHRNQGKVLLYLIQNRLSPKQLVQIVGQNGQKQYQPLAVVQAMKGANVKYDIIVDEGPSSPNQKERVWSLVGENFWNLPPPVQLALLKYSPFPESVVEEVKQAAEQAAQGPQAQMAQTMAMLEAGLKQVETQLKQAQAGKAQAETALIASEIGKPDAPGAAPPQNDPAQHVVKLHEINSGNQVEMARIASNERVAREKTATDAGVKHEATAVERANNLDWMANDQRANAMKLAASAIKDRNKPQPSPKGTDL